MRLTNEQLREYAEFVIKDHAQDVEYISIYEMFELWAEDDEEISDEDALTVRDLIPQAKVTVEW